jgi:hypothetical protein
VRADFRHFPDETPKQGEVIEIRENKREYREGTRNQGASTNWITTNRSYRSH